MNQRMKWYGIEDDSRCRQAGGKISRDADRESINGSLKQAIMYKQYTEPL
jgi:hypothetical protein